MLLEAQSVMRLPQPDWRYVTFAEIAMNISDRVDDPAEAGVERYVGLEHLDSRELRITRWGSPTDVTATKLFFQPGDVIFGKRRAYQRKLAQPDFTGICSAHAMVLRARTDVMLLGILPFFMDTDHFFARALSISVGSLSPTINWRTLAAERFLVPSLAYQQAALELLEAAQRAAVAAGRSFVAARVLTARLRDDAFASAGWPNRPLEDVCSRGPQNGITVPKSVRDGDVGMVNMGELFANEVVEMTSLERVQLSPQARCTHLLMPGDLLFARRSIVAAGAGTCSIVPEHGERATFESSLIRAGVDEAVILPEFLLHYFRSAPGRAALRSIARLGAVAGIAGSDLKQLRVPVPPLKVQQGAVTAIAAAQRASHTLSQHAASSTALRIALSERLLGQADADIH